jgi:hypothetical protein
MVAFLLFADSVLMSIRSSTETEIGPRCGRLPNTLGRHLAFLQIHLHKSRGATRELCEEETILLGMRQSHMLT